MDKKIKIALLVAESTQNYLRQIKELAMIINEEIDSEYDSEIDSVGEQAVVASILISSIKGRLFKPIRIDQFIPRVVTNYRDIEFQQNFRLTRQAYEFLLKEIIPEIKRAETGRPSIDIGKQLLAVIWLLANQESYRSVGERFDMAKSTLSKVFFRIVTVINKIASRTIKWPSEAEMRTIKRKFRSYSKIKNCIGAVDGTYIRIKAPKEQSYCYTNRKKFHSITLQATCDHKLKFTDCSVGYPSSAHDARVFKNSSLYAKAERDSGVMFPGDAVILGDKAYPVMRWCIPPFIDDGTMTIAQKTFNRAHSRARQVVERSFALLFGRWRRLKYIDMKRVEAIPATIMACCVMHNICLMFLEESVDDIMRDGIAQVAISSTNYRFPNRRSRPDGVNLRNVMLANLTMQ